MTPFPHDWIGGWAKKYKVSMELEAYQDLVQIMERMSENTANGLYGKCKVCGKDVYNVECVHSACLKKLLWDD